MVWYNSRLQQHQTVYSISPEPRDSFIKYRCESADRGDPLYADNRHYYQILFPDGSPVTWQKLPEWISAIMQEAITLFPADKAEFPKPNQSFYIQS